MGKVSYSTLSVCYILERTFSKSLIVLLFFTVFLLLASEASATNYYISTTGNDANKGSLAAPFKTIQRGADVATAGDTIFVRDGVYTTSSTYLLIISRSGTSSSPVVFTSENQNGVILDGQNTRDYAIAFINGVSNIKLIDFEIRNFLSHGIISNDDKNKISNITISKCNIHHIGRVCDSEPYGRDGIYLNNTSNFIVENCIIHDIGRYERGENGCSPSNEYFKNHDHGIYVDGVSGLIIRNNVFYNCNRGWALHFYPDPCSNISIFNNTFDYGNMYASAGGYGSHIIFACDLTNVQISNNIFTGQVNYAIFLSSGTYSGILLTNNLAYSGVGGIIDGTRKGISLSGNLLNTNPLIVNEAVFDFNLKATSPAIDAGINIGLPYEGSAPDLGAFEYSSAKSNPQKVTSVTVTGTGGGKTITTYKGTLQLSAEVLPSDATNKTVTWSISNVTGQATISSSGLVTAIDNGTVTARATANDGSGIYGTLVITITNQVISVTGITVTGTGGATTITTNGGKLQLSAAVLPSNATNKAVTWSIVTGTGQATITTTGQVTAVSSGTVTARATAVDGSGVYGTLVITISNQVIPVTSITVTGAGGASTIKTDGGTLQLSVAVLPTNAANKTVTWSITSGSSLASINTSTGLVTAIDNGTITARATANDGSGIYGTLVITITNQVIPITGITVTGTGGATTITTNGGKLQLSAAVLPSNATNKTVTWSIVTGTGKATISTTGQVTAVSSGTVTARATAVDGSGVYGTLVITISNQVIPVTSITVTGAGGASTIKTDGGTLQLSAAVLPSNAANKTVTWSITSGSNLASINTSTGLVTSIDNGTITARATANDGSGIYGTLVITITNQLIPVTSITVTGAGGASTIKTDGGTLQLSAAVLPSNAANKTVTWSITSGSSLVSINTSSGLVTAIDNGTVTARATANDGSGIYGTLVITITNQVISVTGITVTGTGGATTITTNGGKLQLSAAVLPSNATNKAVTWSIVTGTGQATISTTGQVTAVSSGTVTARATAVDGSGVYGTLVITISNQVIPVTIITVTGAGGASTIKTDDGTLQLSAAVLPSNAANKTVTWSITSGSNLASINTSTGLVTAIDNGTITARATANDGSGIYGTLVITITNQLIPVTSITVTGAGGASTIKTDGGTLQLSAAVLPSNAANKTVTWSITSGSGLVSINTSSGLVTAIDNGTVTARATANDGSGIYGTLVITITNQVISVTGITVTGTGGATTITTNGGKLQLSAAVLPSNATNKAVTWSIVTGTGQATITTTGQVTAVSSGTVTARATAVDGSGVYGTLVITISNQVIPVTSITVTGAGGASTIKTDGGTLQLSVAVLPTNAANKTVTWSITSGSSLASINTSTGLVTAIDNGTITARATANDGSGIYGTLVITITNQVIPITGITVTGTGGAYSIFTDNGTLQLSVEVLPDNATNKTIAWSIVNGTGQAKISATGLVTAVNSGTVTARATANDGSGVYGTLTIIISNQVIPVTSITVTGVGGATAISTDGGTLQLSAAVLPANATNKTVTWSITSGSGRAQVNSTTGLVTATDNGNITVRATAVDGSGIYGALVITVSNQVIPVTGITVSGAGGASTIMREGGMLQMNAEILPANATNKTVTWSVTNGTGQATISSLGILTSVADGTVTARATANDGSEVYGTLAITISGQVVQVSDITVTGAGGATTISNDGGTLQLSAVVLPSDVTNKTVTWSITSGSGFASINTSTGLLTATDNGSVTARATANDGSGIYGTLTIMISNQVIPVTSITVTGAGGATAISADGGALQLSAAVLPANAANKTVTWSITSGSGRALVNSMTGLVTATDNGNITVRATAVDGSGIYGALVITITNQVIPVTGITVSGAGGASTIMRDGGMLQMNATVLPANATNKTVTWSLANGTGQATISSSGIVTAVADGTVTARATVNDGSEVYGTLAITISGQVVQVSDITVTGAGGATTISNDGGTLQLSAVVLPSDVTNKTVTWSITSGSGFASINTSTGLLTATDNGSVTARATANDGSGIYGTLTIMISNQVIPVTSITVTGAGGATAISADGGALQLSAAVLPANATNKTVTWSITSGSDRALVNSTTGLVTAADNGNITVRATAVDGTGIYGALVITISNQTIPVEGITVTGEGGVSVIEMNNGTLQLYAEILPSNATNKTVTWSVTNGTGQATVSSSGMITALSDGTITAKANAIDGSGVYGTLTISINNQVIASNMNTPPVIVVSYKSNSYSGFVNEINASASYDINKDNLTYSWEVPDNIPISSTTGSTIKYLGPNVNSAQIFQFTLNVSDGKTIKSKVIPIEILPYKPELEVAEISNIEASSFQYPYYPYNIIDGNIGTMWSADGDNQWLILELKHLFDVQHVKLAFQPGQKRESYFDILGSEDKVNWEPILIKSVSCSFSSNLQVFEFPVSKTGKAFKYIKLIGLGNSSDKLNCISELKIFGYNYWYHSNYEDQPVKIYPNPAHDFFNIRIDEPSFTFDIIQIVTLSGKVVFQGKINPETKDVQIPIDLISGTYIVKLGTGNSILITLKLIVI